MPELPAIGTIKRKLLDDLIREEVSADELAKRHGLNGHDLVKNLEQLRKEGFVETQWGAGDRIIRIRARRGALNMAQLERPAASYSPTQSDIAAKLAAGINALPWLSEEWRQWDPEKVRAVSGLKLQQVSAGLMQLREQGRLQQLGGGGRGKRIEGVRWRGERGPAAAEQPAPEESATNGSKASPAAAQDAYINKLRQTMGVIAANQASPPTPELDKYIAAKELAEKAPHDNPFISIEFTPMPIAEEAIILKRRLEGTG